MANNYTIEVKAKKGGMTGGASQTKQGNSGMANPMAARQSAIARQKELESKGGSGGAKSVESMRVLARSLNTLTREVKKLEATIRAKGGIGGSGGGSGGGGSDVGKGIMSAGAAIPFAGAVLAATGFLVSKISEIGNSYIEKMGEQSKTVGVAGMHSGAGMYLQTEMGSGMKSYATATGRFADGKDPTSEMTGLKVGAIYGQSADEAMGTAGKFARAGADQRSAVATMMGGGIETQLPTLLSKMAEEMEEAVQNGFDASEMAKTMPDLLTKITMSSKTKDVNVAISASRAAAGSKSAAGKGQIEDMGSFMAWRTGQNKAVEQFNDDKFIENELAVGNIDASHAQKIKAYKAANGGKLDRRGLEDSLGAGISNTYYQSAVNGLSETEIQVDATRQMTKLFDPNGKRSFAERRAAVIMGGQSLGVDQGGMAGTDALLRMNDPKYMQKPDAGKGAAILDDRYGKVKGSVAGYSVDINQEREKFQMDNGRPLADATMTVEKGMRDLATGGIATMSKALDLLNGKIASTADELEDYKQKTSKMSTLEYAAYAAKHPWLELQAGWSDVSNLFSSGKE